MKIEKIKDCVTPQIKKELASIGYWPSSADPSNSVPMYHVASPQAFNQIIGYAKFINGSNGTVLYRGQSENHPSLLPSGARKDKIPVPDSTIDTMRSDEYIQKFFKLDHEDIKGWERYQNMLIESVLQHYGGNTYCMDFVDNHWCALWFGLYNFVDNSYVRRSGPDEKLYIYLYLADTNGACVRGMYIGEDTFIVDLRKALPSTFSRPAAQHGWIVRKHKRGKCDYNDRVIGVLEINVDDAARWLGEGELLSPDNFFPDFSRDQGYKVLLWRQFRSGLSSPWPKILPANTICNYHYTDTYFSSSPLFSPSPCYPIKTNSGEEVKNITGLYKLLVERGWTKETCLNESIWNEENPAVGQSAVTALIVQKCFGGEVLYFNYSNRKHYFNLIGDCYFDLTYEELDNAMKADYPPISSENLGYPRNTYRKKEKELNILLQNCDLSIS